MCRFVVEKMGLLDSYHWTYFLNMLLQAFSMTVFQNSAQKTKQTCKQSLPSEPFQRTLTENRLCSVIITYLQILWTTWGRKAPHLLAIKTKTRLMREVCEQIYSIHVFHSTEAIRAEDPEARGSLLCLGRAKLDSCCWNVVRLLKCGCDGGWGGTE